MRQQPMVSIIIPVYNGSNYMRQAIDSALAQTYANKEVLVINDGSRDGGETERIALSYSDSIRYFHKDNGGVASALNMGVANMRGEYFSWLSHDDLYAPEKVEAEVGAVLAERDQTAVIACAYEVFSGETGKTTGVVNALDMYTRAEMERPLFGLFRGVIHGCSLLLHRSHFERVGGFDESLPTTQDYDLFFRMFRGQTFRYLPKPYVRSRVHASQGSRGEEHAREGSSLWIRYMDLITDEERVDISGSPYMFYHGVYRFLRKAAPYDMAEAHAQRKAARLMLDGAPPRGTLLAPPGDEKEAVAFLKGFAAAHAGERVTVCGSEEDRGQLKALPGALHFCASVLMAPEGEACIWDRERKFAFRDASMLVTLLSELGLRVLVYAGEAKMLPRLRVRREARDNGGDVSLLAGFAKGAIHEVKACDYAAYDRVVWTREEPYRILRAEDSRHIYASDASQIPGALDAERAQAGNADEGALLREAYRALLRHCRETEALEIAEELREHYEHTLSWKITRPLRDAKFWLKRILKRG